MDRSAIHRTPLRHLARFAAALLVAAAPAAADTAVVPADFPSIQQAVDAVQGTTGAVVRIDSDATCTSARPTCDCARTRQ